MNLHNRRSGSFRALSMFVMVASVLVFSQILLAGKQAAKKVEARVVYSGQFKGHVEPCG